MVSDEWVIFIVIYFGMFAVIDLAVFQVRIFYFLLLKIFIVFPQIQQTLAQLLHVRVQVFDLPLLGSVRFGLVLTWLATVIDVG